MHEYRGDGAQMPPHGVETLAEQVEFEFLIVYGQTTVFAPVVIIDEVHEQIKQNFGEDAQVIKLRLLSRMETHSP